MPSREKSIRLGLGDASQAAAVLDAGAMDLLMVAAELGPYVRATEAAESVASLGKALRQLGHEVTICLPRHPGFEQQGLLVARRLTPVTAGGGEEVTVLDGQLASGVRLILLDAPGQFDDGVIYGGAEPRRFGWFARATAAFCAQRASQGHPFDVVHVHDWPGALAAVALRRLSPCEVPIVLTVHDWQLEGSFPGDQARDLELDAEALSWAELEGRVSVLKAGLLRADAVASVSDSAFRETMSDPANALGAWMRSHGPAVVGVPDGVDYALYNPATDPLIISRYDAEDVSNKGRSKSDLVCRLGLELEPERPLVAAVGEASIAAGFDLLVQAMPALLRQDLTLVIAATNSHPLTAELGLMDELGRVAERRPDTLAWLRDPDESTVHRLLAAADLVVIPSRHEPCGAVVLRAARYGAVPVAHASGAVRDLVVDADPELATGTGFLYDEATPEALVGGLQRALIACANPGWGGLRRRVMRQDLSWDRPARRYQKMYRQAVAARRG